MLGELMVIMGMFSRGMIRIQWRPLRPLRPLECTGRTRWRDPLDVACCRPHYRMLGTHDVRQHEEDERDNDDGVNKIMEKTIDGWG
jgi:hypothetical protein